jgi:chromosome segregation ATPase
VTKARREYEQKQQELQEQIEITQKLKNELTSLEEVHKKLEDELHQSEQTTHIDTSLKTAQETEDSHQIELNKLQNEISTLTTQIDNQKQLQQHYQTAIKQEERNLDNLRRNLGDTLLKKSISKANKHLEKELNEIKKKKQEELDKLKNQLQHELEITHKKKEYLENLQQQMTELQAQATAQQQTIEKLKQKQTNLTNQVQLLIVSPKLAIVSVQIIVRCSVFVCLCVCVFSVFSVFSVCLVCLVCLVCV